MRKNMASISWLACVAALFVRCGPTPDTALSRAAAQGNVEQVRSLLRGGASPDDMGTSGVTPLMWASRAGHVPVVKALLEGGAGLDVRDRHVNGWTALIHAIHKGQNEVARLILEAGADPNARVDGGATALMFAAAYGNTAMVRALLEKGADPYAEGTGGVTALWNAVGGGAIFDFTDGPHLGTCFPGTVQALLEKAPDLKLKRGFSGKLVAALGRSKECSELIARLEE